MIAVKMNDHLTIRQLAEWLTSAEVDEPGTPEVASHLAECAACRSSLGTAETLLRVAAEGLAQDAGCDPICPGDEVLAAHAEGKLSFERRGEVEAHLARCPVCRLLVQCGEAGDEVAPPPSVGRRRHAVSSHRGVIAAAAAVMVGALAWVAFYASNSRVHAGAGSTDLAGLTPDWVFDVSASGDLLDRISRLDRILSEQPDAADARYMRACLYHNLIESEPFGAARPSGIAALLADADALVTHHPGWHRAWAIRAEARRLDGDLKEAIEDANEAIQRHPQAGSLLTRAKCYLELGRLAEARKDYYNVFNYGPDRRESADANIGLATVLRELALSDQKTRREALAEFGLGVVQGTPLAKLYAYRARSVIHLLQGDDDNAVRDSRRALEIDPGEPYAALLLWQALRRTGDVDGAARVIQKAARSASVGEDRPAATKADADWSNLLVRFCAGTIDRDELLAEANTSQRHCEATYYAGELALDRDGPEVARAWYDRCIATGKKRCNEYHLARRRLESIAAAAVGNEVITVSPS